ncbi:MAG TPA: hypothetical protein VEW04_10115 [Allosphingosinicella sp.]|nr:hypothetical protein [Allosphingosinicella sp.]
MLLVIALIAAEPAIAEAPAVQNPDEMVCVSVRQVGSRLGRERRCLTRAQWAEDRANQRRNTEDAQTGQTNPQGMNPGERGLIGGRYVAPPARGGRPN